MRILFLTDNFPPEVNAPASRTFEHCREWVKAGQRVAVITCFPNFPKGEVFDGYRNHVLPKRETMEGIDVIRVWSYITANEGFIKRILDYLSFMISAILVAPFTPKADIVIGTSPHFFTACGACIVGKMKRAPFIFELRDIWPESIKAVGAMKNSILIRMLKKIEMFLYRKAARIVSVTESFKRILIKRGVNGEKIKVITNGVDLNGFQPRPKNEALLAKFNLEGKFVAGYVGTHGMAHALETILECADVVQKMEGGDVFHFILLGNGAKKQELIAKANTMGLKNVRFIDSVPKGDVANYWALLDVSIIHLKKTDLFTTVIPSKLFECMGMGIPVLHGVAGESAEIVEKEGVGLVFEPENTLDLREKLVLLKENKKLYQRLHDNCLAAAPRYNRSVLAGQMLGVLSEAVDRRSALEF